MVTINYTNKCLTSSICVFVCCIIILMSYISIDYMYRSQFKSNSINFDGIYINHTYTKSYYACNERKFAYTLNKPCIKRLPNCLIIGTQKSGTEALLIFLAAHPQIVRNINLTEYHFFSLHYSVGFDWYKKQMPCSRPDQLVIEKSPSYFVYKAAPSRVYQMDSKIKLLLIVRNPIGRTISNYYMAKRRWQQQQKTGQAYKKLHEYSNASMYFPSLESIWRRHVQQYDTNFENWIKFFPLKQLHIVDGDALSRFPFDELRKIENFLEIDHCFDESMFALNYKGFYCLRNPEFRDNRKLKETKSLSGEKGHHHPNISASLLQTMKEFFRPHNERFFNLSGRHFDWDM